MCKCDFLWPKPIYGFNNSWIYNADLDEIEEAFSPSSTAQAFDAVNECFYTINPTGCVWIDMRNAVRTELGSPATKGVNFRQVNSPLRNHQYDQFDAGIPSTVTYDGGATYKSRYPANGYVYPPVLGTHHLEINKTGYQAGSSGGALAAVTSFGYYGSWRLYTSAGVAIFIAVDPATGVEVASFTCEIPPGELVGNTIFTTIVFNGPFERTSYVGSDFAIHTGRIFRNDEVNDGATIAGVGNALRESGGKVYCAGGWVQDPDTFFQLPHAMNGFSGTEYVRWSTAGVTTPSKGRLDFHSWDDASLQRSCYARRIIAVEDDYIIGVDITPTDTQTYGPKEIMVVNARDVSDIKCIQSLGIVDDFDGPTFDTNFPAIAWVEPRLYVCRVRRSTTTSVQRIFLS